MSLEHGVAELRVRSCPMVRVRVPASPPAWLPSFFSVSCALTKLSILHDSFPLFTSLSLPSPPLLRVYTSPFSPIWKANHPSMRLVDHVTSAWWQSPDVSYGQGSGPGPSSSVSLFLLLCPAMSMLSVFHVSSVPFSFFSPAVSTSFIFMTSNQDGRPIHPLVRQVDHVNLAWWQSSASTCVSWSGFESRPT
jgi:hypothetical protein